MSSWLIVAGGLLILLGSIAIAGGGIITARGWNIRIEEQQRAGLIKELSAELFKNINIIQNRKFSETDESKLKERLIPNGPAARYVDDMAGSAW